MKAKDKCSSVVEVRCSSARVVECCKVQWGCVHQKIVLYKSYLLLLLLLPTLPVTVRPWDHIDFGYMQYHVPVC